MFSMTFIVASTGCGQYEWTTAPPWDLWGTSDWFGKLHHDSGLTAAFLGTAAHWLVARVVVQQGGREPSFAPAGELVSAAGAAFVALSFVSSGTFAFICDVSGFAGAMNGDCRRDFRAVPESVLAALNATRHQFWGALGVLGLTLLAIAGFGFGLRWAWLRRVARDEIPEFALVPIDALGDGEPPPGVRFAELPFRRPRRVLVRRASGGLEVIGTVP